MTRKKGVSIKKQRGGPAASVADTEESPTRLFPLGEDIYASVVRDFRFDPLKEMDARRI